VSYRYFDYPGLREQPINKGEQVIWIAHSRKSPGYNGAKALADTPENHLAIRIEAVSILAKQLQSRDFETWAEAVWSARALVEAQIQASSDTDAVKPLIEPLFSHAGYGGIGRGESMAAEQLLARIGKPAVPFLFGKLDSTEARERRLAVTILTAMGALDAETVSAIRPLLHDKDTYVRRAVIDSLSKLSTESAVVVDDLKRAVNDKVVGHRFLARAALVRIGIDEERHILAIAKHLKQLDADGYDPPAAQAARILGELGPKAKMVWPELVSALESPNPSIRVNSAQALGSMHADSDQAIGALVNLLSNEPEREVRRSAAAALGTIGPKAQTAIAPLAEILRQADKESRDDPNTDRTGWWVAARALGQIGGPDAIAVLEQALNNHDPDIRARTACRRVWPSRASWPNRSPEWYSHSSCATSANSLFAFFACLFRESYGSAVFLLRCELETSFILTGGGFLSPTLCGAQMLISTCSRRRWIQRMR
jgi:HEAT repeat protein